MFVESSTVHILMFWFVMFDKKNLLRKPYGESLKTWFCICSVYSVQLNSTVEHLAAVTATRVRILSNTVYIKLKHTGRSMGPWEQKEFFESVYPKWSYCTQDQVIRAHTKTKIFYPTLQNILVHTVLSVLGTRQWHCSSCRSVGIRVQYVHWYRHNQYTSHLLLRNSVQH